ncbi:MAG TPA: pyridoxamine 5'-phosphate oxidase [Thermoleophilaceae bacterium]|nr:pyridoxamine 5'-phosphate oxidase [Thermoleophilaceae bacterium]
MTDFAKPLREEDADADPLKQFAAWFEEAGEATRAPEAMALATATPDGAPSVRMVLMKGFDERGFTFFSNYESRKGGELLANPRAALLFHWDALGRQVRIEGPVERVHHEESGAYVRSRPRGSQLSALASPQSRPVSGRAELERLVEEVTTMYQHGDLPLPENWGGYRLRPERYEFWQHREDRLHDRLLYTPADAGWTVQRLAP